MQRVNISTESYHKDKRKNYITFGPAVLGIYHQAQSRREHAEVYTLRTMSFIHTTFIFTRDW